MVWSCSSGGCICVGILCVLHASRFWLDMAIEINKSQESNRQTEPAMPATVQSVITVPRPCSTHSVRCPNSVLSHNHHRIPREHTLSLHPKSLCGSLCYHSSWGLWSPSPFPVYSGGARVFYLNVHVSSPSSSSSPPFPCPSPTAQGIKRLEVGR